MSIASNLAAVIEKIAAATKRAGRNPADIALMAVSKTQSPEKIIEAYNAGQRLFGENRVQEFAEKFSSLAELPATQFHMIGHLQSNKAVKAVEIFHAIDSVDSVRLAQRLNTAAAEMAKTIDVLIEVNVGGEDAKSGVDADLTELEPILLGAAEWTHLRVRGLMTVPPFTEDPEGARPYFRKLRELRDLLAERNFPSVTLPELSMGMSHDFEVAIEEGSTCVRVGTAIFGERPKP